VLDQSLCFDDCVVPKGDKKMI